MVWDEGLTIYANIKRLGTMTDTYPRAFARNYRLRFIGKKPRTQKVDMTRINPGGVDKLRNAGYTYRQIALLHGVTRQRIEQIMSRWKYQRKVRR